MRDCINTIKSLIDTAIELGHKCVGITDHETISGHLRALRYYQKIKKNNPDFKLVLGNEIYLCRNGLNKSNFIRGKDRYYHFCLYAKNIKGHQQIRELSTRAYMRSYMAYGQRRVPTYYQDLIDIIGRERGNVIASSSCLGGALPTQLLKYRDEESPQLLANIKKWIKQINGIFGQGYFYLELQPAATAEQKYVNRKLIGLSKELNVPYIFTTDSHYLRAEDRPIHKAFLTAQNGEREVDDFYKTTYMMSQEELESFLDLTEEELAEGYTNIAKIADMCEDYDLTKPLRIPQLPWKKHNPKGQISDWYNKIPMLETFMESEYIGDKVLAATVVERLEWDTTLQNQRAYDELNSNLNTSWISSNVNNTHWSAYYLNLERIIEECWNAGSIVGPGRGSGVGFLLLYVLNITQINPLREKTQLFEWRFLNPERVSVLDIDFDIEGGQRKKVLNSFRQVYGNDRVANVVTFRTEKSKSAILTAARGLGIDVDVAQYLASMIPADRGQLRTLHECFYGNEEKDYKPITQFVYEMTNNYPEIWSVAQKIEGLICGIGVHAGGVIFVDEPFTNSTALMRAPDGTICTQYELHDSESVSQIEAHKYLTVYQQRYIGT